MIVLPAPNFGAAGAYLAAPYSLDFSKDLNYIIPIEGTWQGDRKKGYSLYIDNYGNNISITVSSGNYSVRIPAYTSAYIDVRGFNDIFISSDSVGSSPSPVRLSTEVKQTEMISRGNAPVTSSVTPFSYVGSINLTSTYGDGPMVYCPDNNCIYFFPSNKPTFLVIDCAQNKVVSVVQYSASITNSLCIAYYKNKVYVGFQNAILMVVDTVSNSQATYNLTSQIGSNYNITLMAMHEAEGYLYFSTSAGTTYRIISTIAAGAVRVGNSSTQGVYMFYAPAWGGILSLYGDGVNQPYLFRYSGGLQQSNVTLNFPYLNPFGVGCYDAASDTLFLEGQNGSSTQTFIYACGLAAGTGYSVEAPNSTVTALQICFNPSNNYLYISNYDVFDNYLRGIVGVMPTSSNFRRMVYNSSNGYTYFWCANSILKWGK